MRFSLIAATAAAAFVAPGLAGADPTPGAERDPRVAAATLGIALDNHDSVPVIAAFAAKVRIQGLTFMNRACTRAFGGKRTRTITKKAHAKLATCLVDAGWTLGAAPNPVPHGKSWRLLASHDHARLTLELTPQKDGTLRLAAVQFALADLIQPMTFTRTGDGDEGGVMDGEEGGVAGGVVGGEIGGEPPPPPPMTAPQNVAPTALEARRIAGDKLITPDDDTKTEIAKSGKTKVVASFKLCIDVTGAPSQVKSLKSSGFPAYDTALVAGIKAWRYRPYLVNGTPTAVCTAVTFVYSQK